MLLIKQKQLRNFVLDCCCKNKKERKRELVEDVETFAPESLEHLFGKG